jgi:hypothetical protein
MAMKLPEDFREFLRSFGLHGVKYLLIGGYAVVYHGYPRSTGGLDVWIAISPENAERIVAALRDPADPKTSRIWSTWNRSRLCGHPGA